MAAEDMSISSGGLYDALYGENSSFDSGNESKNMPELSPSAMKYLGGQ